MRKPAPIMLEEDWRAYKRGAAPRFVVSAPSSPKKAPRLSLREMQVIVKLIEAGHTQQFVADMFGVSQALVSRVKSQILGDAWQANHNG